MGYEIERKFLIIGTAPIDAIEGERLVQGYFDAPDATIRVRTIGDANAVLTIKTATTGVTRGEWEYSIPFEDAEALIANFCQGRTLSKTRYKIPHGKHVWELDVFDAPFKGLVVAEIELTSEDEAFEKPDWIGEEVSGDARYFNQALVYSQTIPS